MPFHQTSHLTKAQSRALLQVYDRCPLFQDISVRRPKRVNVNPLGWNFSEAERFACEFTHLRRVSFLQFRRSCVYMFDCVLVPWLGMHLGIEHDGYTHS